MTTTEKRSFLATFGLIMAATIAIVILLAVGGYLLKMFFEEVAEEADPAASATQAAQAPQSTPAANQTASLEVTHLPDVGTLLVKWESTGGPDWKDTKELVSEAITSHDNHREAERQAKAARDQARKAQDQAKREVNKLRRDVADTLRGIQDSVNNTSFQQGDRDEVRKTLAIVQHIAQEQAKTVQDFAHLQTELKRIEAAVNANAARQQAPSPQYQLPRPVVSSPCP